MGHAPTGSPELSRLGLGLVQGMSPWVVLHLHHLGVCYGGAELCGMHWLNACLEAAVRRMGGSPRCAVPAGRRWHALQRVACMILADANTASST